MADHMENAMEDRAVEDSVQAADLPAESTQALLERSAIALAVELRAVPLRDGDLDDSDRYCPPEELRVWWSDPGVRPLYGGYLLPLGPAPENGSTSRVNGIVAAPRSTYAYMGFEAEWLPTEARWEVYPVPGVA